MKTNRSLSKFQCLFYNFEIVLTLVKKKTWRILTKHRPVRGNYLFKGNRRSDDVQLTSFRPRPQQHFTNRKTPPHIPQHSVAIPASHSSRVCSLFSCPQKTKTFTSFWVYIFYLFTSQGTIKQLSNKNNLVLYISIDISLLYTKCTVFYVNNTKRSSIWKSLAGLNKTFAHLLLVNNSWP